MLITFSEMKRKHKSWERSCLRKVIKELLLEVTSAKSAWMAENQKSYLAAKNTKS